METRKLFQEALADLEVQPSPQVWEKVEAALDRGKKKPAGWWWLGAGLLLLLLSGAALWYFLPVSPGLNRHPVSVALSKSDTTNKAHANTSSTRAADTVINKAPEPKTMTVATDSLITPSPVSEQAEITGAPSASFDRRTKTIFSNGVSEPVQNQRSISQAPSYHSASSQTGAPPSLNNPASGKPSDASHTANSSNPVSQKQLISTKQKFAGDSGMKSQTSVVKESASNQGKNTARSPDAVNKPLSPAKTGSTDPKKDSTSSSLEKALASKAAEEMKATASQKNTAVADSTSKKLSDAGSKPSEQNLPELKASSTPQSKDSLAGSIKPLKNDSALIRKAADSLLAATPKLGPKTDSAKAQEASLPAFSISGYFSPEFGKNMIQNNKSNFNVGNENQNPRAAGGVRFGISFRDKVEVSIACAYSQVNQESNSQVFYFPKALSQPFVFNSSFGDMAVPAAAMLSTYSQLAPVTMFKAKYQYSETLGLLNLPISASIHLNKGRFRTYVSAGINIQYAFSQHATLEVIKENETVREEYSSLDVRKLNYAAALGLGAEYSISKHIGVFLEPNARLNLLSTTNNTATVKSSAYFTGCAAGIKVSL
ncbi:MAG TPA: outer membrane beta-barrel protein [Bacteroidia bacterium]|nr:outer membrane beta-barrel protein [Bacteroidia bacterium]